MSADAVPKVPPQLPPLSPHASLASPSEWKLQFPLEDTKLPPNSLSMSSSSSSLRRSNSRSPPRQLPDPHLDQVASDSATRSRARHSPPLLRATSQSRAHTLVRSTSRALPTLPSTFVSASASASTAEPTVITPPIRTHSRSASVGLPKLVRPPASGDKDATPVPPLPPPPSTEDGLRPLPRPPKQQRPPPFPVKRREQSSQPSVSQPPSKVATSAPIASAVTFDNIPTTQTPESVPPRRQLKRNNSTPHLRRIAPVDPAAVPPPEPSPLPVVLPLSAPVRRTGKEDANDKVREKERRLEFAVPDQSSSFLSMEEPDSPLVRPPARAPTPPKPRMATRAVYPTAARHASDSRRQGSGTAGNSTSPSPSPALRGRAVEVAVKVRSPPPPSTTLEGKAPAVSQPRATESFARKWVLEKKGKRLTQDSLVVAQQLRMLR